MTCRRALFHPMNRRDVYLPEPLFPATFLPASVLDITHRDVRFSREPLCNFSTVLLFFFFSLVTKNVRTIFYRENQDLIDGCVKISNLFNDIFSRKSLDPARQSPIIN